MQVEATCTVNITSTHVEKFLLDCDDPLALYWVIRSIAIDEAKMKALRKFFADKPSCLPVIEALQGLRDALDKLNQQKGEHGS